MSTPAPIMTTASAMESSDVGVNFGSVTQKTHFYASNRLYKNEWDEEKNEQVFGDGYRGNLYRYTVKAKFSGPIDPESGLIADLNIIRKWMKEAVLDELGDKNLPVDVFYFRSVVSTVENLVVYIWQQLTKAMGPDCSVTLQKVKIATHDSENRVVSYHGEEDGE